MTTVCTKVMGVEPIRLNAVVGQLNDWYPPALAEKWDSVGLIVGDPQAPVRRILVALDPVASVVDEALAWNADLIVTHHPLFLKPVHQVAASTYKGALVHRLIAGGCALFNAHTNADRARGGVADSLAEALGLRDTQPLAPATADPTDKISVFVPLDAADRVHAAMTAAGAGTIGEYRGCAWRTAGTGTFTASQSANPAVGAPGQTTTVDEFRLEMVAPRSHRGRVIAAIIEAHPYEEPAFDIVELAALPTDLGLGRVGSLPEPTTLRSFAEHAARVLPPTAQGLRVAGDLDAPVSRIAVVGGSGDSMIDEARAAGADVYLTSDLRHHPVSEARERAALGDGRPYLVDTAHFASESVWLGALARRLSEYAAAQGEGAATFEVAIAQASTDPWDAHVPAPDFRNPNASLHTDS